MVKDISGDGDELLRFPVAYPIKVVGRRSDTMRANIYAIVRAHVPDLEESQITERESNQQHFLELGLRLHTPCEFKSINAGQSQLMQHEMRPERRHGVECGLSRSRRDALVAPRAKQ